MATRKEMQKTGVARLVAIQNRVLKRLKRAYPKWMKRSDLADSLSSPITADVLTMAMTALEKRGLIETKIVVTGELGRPPVVYRLTKRPGER